MLDEDEGEYDDCDRCGANVVKEEELRMRPGELLSLWKEHSGLKPGYYRVLSWPIYLDGYITAHIIVSALEFVLPLDRKGKAAAKEAWTPGGRLCKACRDELEKKIKPPLTRPTPLSRHDKGRRQS